ncbi:GATA transcription factor 8-like [Coffea arabica]|uniref:GATA transcription factor n=1 Tax=Coffea arabica TaxID=13443 RepID=A0ABM4WEU4_COFAR
MGPNFVDEIDCGSFFDHIDDLIEFPPENECGNGLVGSGDCKNFPSLWDEALPDTDTLFTGNTSNSASDLSAELSVPYEDIVQLEWLSTFVEDSFSGGGMTLSKDNSSVNKDNPCNQFQTSSPVSVLESSSSSSSSSCSGGKTIPLSPNHRGPQRARSKRPRPATFNPRPAIQLISPPASFSEAPHLFLAPGVSSESENFAESEFVRKFPKPAGGEHKKKKKIKLTVPLGPMEINQNSASQAVRKCMHCEITKTPQWRAGPMGPKTLCNACGVRYKSGRLFPEYRPAASPTFVPSLHSNSHKKVLEMRGKVVEENTTAGTAAKASAAGRELVPESKPSLEYI